MLQKGKLGVQLIIGKAKFLFQTCLFTTNACCDNKVNALECGLWLKRYFQNVNFSFYLFVVWKSVSSGCFVKGRNHKCQCYYYHYGCSYYADNHNSKCFLWCGSIKYGIVLCTYKQEFILCLKVHVFKVIATSCPAPVKQSITVWLVVTFFPPLCGGYLMKMDWFCNKELSGFGFDFSS